MKAITLSQPFASLVAAGAKLIETRSWSTDYRGPLGVHAAKRIPAEFRSLWLQEPFLSALHKAGVVSIGPGQVLGKFFGADSTGYQLLEENYHLGCVIATCVLSQCVRIPKKPTKFIAYDPRRFGQTLIIDPGTRATVIVPPGEPELSFGDYTADRYAWLLSDVRPLPEPIPARGALGLWEWDEKKA